MVKLLRYRPLKADFSAQRYSINATEGFITLKRIAANPFDQYKITLTGAEAGGLEQFLADIDNYWRNWPPAPRKGF